MSLHLYVNLRDGRAHLDRECVRIALIPDGAIRLWHGSSSLIPGDLKFCTRCCRVSLAHVHALVHTEEGESSPAQRGDPEGVDTPSSVCDPSGTWARERWS